MLGGWKWMVGLVLVLGLLSAAASAEEDQLNRVARSVRYMLMKRKPSIGLSLAEYMAEGGKGDNFHFLPSRRSAED